MAMPRYTEEWFCARLEMGSRHVGQPIFGAVREGIGRSCL